MAPTASQTVLGAQHVDRAHGRCRANPMNNAAQKMWISETNIMER